MVEQDPRPNRGRKPTVKVFWPYLLLGAVLVLAFIWIYIVGPAGESEDRGQGLHVQDPQTTEAPAEGVQLEGATTETQVEAVEAQNETQREAQGASQ